MGVALDTVHDEAFVTDYVPLGLQPVSVFALAAGGDVPPLRTIAGPATGFFRPMGIAVDPVNDEIFVANYGNKQISVFARGANGNVRPIRTLNTGLYGATHIIVDPANDELILLTPCVVLAYPRTASGSAAKLRSIAGGQSDPQRMTLDLKNNEVIVANRAADSITAHSLTGNDYPPPLRTISGSATGLNRPAGVADDPFNNELIVANNLFSIAAFPRVANGNVAPQRTISGPATDSVPSSM